MSAFAFACGGDESKCQTAEDCGLGFECTAGACVACPAEVQYDGKDNDCNPLTKDLDLDGDGDNAKDAQIMPGGDCDDRDRTVSSKLSEVCGDGKDNDCDGRIDAPLCDVRPPTVTIRSPIADGLYGGDVPVDLNVVDPSESGITGVDLKIDGATVGTLNGAPFTGTFDSSRIPDGEHELTVVVSGANGGTAMASVRIRIDNTAPQLMVMPGSGTTVAGRVRFTAVASDANGVRSITSGTSSSTSSPFTFEIDFEAIPPGPFTLMVSASDQAVVDGASRGNVTTQTLALTVENLGPLVSFRTPAAGRSYAGDVTIAGEIGDPQGIASAEIQLDGRQIYAGTSTSFSVRVDTNALTEGAHTLTAITQDNDGNRRMQTAPLLIDRTGPTFAFTPPNNASVVGVVTLTVDASDTAGILEISSDGNTVNVSPLTQVHDFSASNGGTHSQVVRARDATIIDGVEGIGNAATATLTWTVRNAGPSVTANGPPAGNGYGGFVTFDASATDPNGVARVELYHPAVGLLASDDTAPYVLRGDTRDVPDGIQAFELRAHDLLGNTSSVSHTIRVDNTGPVVTFVEPMMGAMLTDTVPVEVSASDPSGVRAIESYGNQSASTPFAFMLDSLLLPNGSVSLDVNAWDDAIVDDAMGVGNRSISRLAVNVFNEENAIAININSPSPGEDVYREVLFSVDAQAVSGIAFVEFFLDGVLVDIDYQAAFETTIPLFDLTGVITLTAEVHAINGSVQSGTVQAEIVPRARMRAATQYPVVDMGGGPYALHDFDGDGVRELVTGGNELSYHRGFGSGRFGAIRRLAGLTSALAIEQAVGGPEADLLALNSGGALSIYENIGAGEFAIPPQEVFVNGVITVAMATGDIDADGDIDVVLGSLSMGADIFILQNVNGVFRVVGARGTSGTVSDVVLTDVDNNGTLDLVLGREGTTEDRVSVYRNVDGRGLFLTPPVHTRFDGPPRRVAVGDLNGDAFPDIVALTPEVLGSGVPGVSITLGTNLTGRWPDSAAADFDLPLGNDVELGDVDGDGDLDILALGRLYSGARVYFNNGSGAFTRGPQYTLGVEPQFVELIDFDEDGFLDIVASTADSVAYGRGLGGGAYNAAVSQSVTNADPSTILFHQMRGGPDLDVVLGLDLDSPRLRAGVRIHENDGTNAFPVRLNYESPLAGGVDDLAVGNLDNAGFADIAIAANTYNALCRPAGEPEGRRDCDRSQCLNQFVCYDELGATGVSCVSSSECGRGCFSPCRRSEGGLLLATGSSYTTTVLNRDDSFQVAMGDVMSGGFDEAVFGIANPVNGEGIEVLDRLGQPRFDSFQGTGITDVIIHDAVEPTGRDDILVSYSAAANVTVFRQEVGGLGQPEPYVTIDPIMSFGVGTLAGDTRPDLICLSVSNLVELQGSAVATFDFPTFTPLDGVLGFTRELAVGDFNADGLSDVVTFDAIRNNALVFVARAMGGFFPPEPVPMPVGAIDVVAADINRDGFSEFVVLTRQIAYPPFVDRGAFTIYFNRP